MSGSAESSEVRFEFLARVSESTTARVELCRISGGEHDGGLVAVKRPRLEDNVIPQLVAMFRDETKMTESLRHEHIVRLVCWGTDEQGPYFATEFLRGVALARLLRTVVKTGDSFPERIVASLAIRICRGLAVAHELRSPSGEPLGLVHRDLTPANVLLGFDGEVKISDFGLAKTKRCSSKTVTGMVKGTCEYMAPEQVRGESLDARVDLFAMGVILFELLSGRRPWQGRTPVDTMQKVAEDPLPSLAALRPGLHETLLALVERCLAKDPAERMQSASDLERELTQWMIAKGHSDRQDQLARFVRRHSMRQMRWCERAVAGELADSREGEPLEALGGDEGGDPAEASPEAAGRVVVGAGGGGRVRPFAPTQPMQARPDLAKPPDTEPNITPEDADDAPTLAQSIDHAAALAVSSTQPDLDLVQEDTLDTEHTMPSMMIADESTDDSPGASPPPRSRPVFVALPRSTPPPADRAAKPVAAQQQADKPVPAATAKRSAASAAKSPSTASPDTVTDVGPHQGVVYRDAREIMAEAARHGSASDRAAREALNAAQRARMAAEAAQFAAERAELSGRAAVLAHRAIAAAEVGDLDGAVDLLKRAKELRSGNQPGS
ncbi:MAG: protein kinase [Deltaproteobacteria bacterium]|jgi:serine/threonine-protein kinase|nr:protein kinase [Deltaproteobacteria bacterium]MBW2537394.1 protein kinase [Deltaproteobacteria bacterium]